MAATDKDETNLEPHAQHVRPLMFAAFVCSATMMSFVSLIGPIARLVGLSASQIGLAMTIAGLAWLAMVRTWGRLSDAYGRRSIILAGQTGFAVSYLLLCLFIDTALAGALSVAVALAGLASTRAMVGLFYGALPVTTAALIADNTPPAKRARAMATIGAAGAAGMVAGPGLAGLLAPFSLSSLLYSTAFLPFLALAWLWITVPQSQIVAHRKASALKLSDRRLRRPLMLAFVAMFGVAVAQITIGFFALDRLHLSPAEAARTAGMALAVVGAALVVAQVVLRSLAWPPERLIRWGGTIGGIGFVSVLQATDPYSLWAAYAIAAFGMGWVHPSVSALAANAVGAHDQGAAAGSVAFAQGLGVILGPLIGTAVYSIDATLPYLLTGAALLLSAQWPARRN